MLALATVLAGARALSTTGEHDLWAGTAAARPTAGGAQVRMVSASAQDADLIADTWTVTTGAGSDLYLGLVVEGDSHYALSLPALASAINEGTKTTSGIWVYSLPSVGQGVDIEIGAATYQWLRTSEATIDEAATAIAAVMAADPLYDFFPRGSGSGAIASIAKLPGVETAEIVATITDDGDIVSTPLFAHGPASATHTATESGGTLTIVRDVAGVSSTVTADTDLVVPVHAVTGAAGTGVQKVRLTYIGANGRLAKEVVVLNGTTAVNSVATDVAHVLELEATEAGTGGVAAGLITCELADGTDLEHILAGRVDSATVGYVAPAASSDMWLAGVSATPANTTVATLRIYATRRPGETADLGKVLLWTGYVTPEGLDLDWSNSPLGPFTAGTRVWATLEGNGATCAVELLAY